MQVLWKHVLPLALLALVAVALLALSPPFLTAVPYRDSGVFLYVGERMLHGDVPYRDVWDHKTPLIYFLDAFGLWLGGGSLWGVWGVQFVSLLAALLLGFYGFRSVFGPVGAWVGSLSWAGGVFVALEHGNLTEEYALPLKFAALWALLRLQRSPSRVGPLLVLGLTATLAALLKPNLIGLHVAVVLVLVGQSLWHRNWQRLWTDLAWLGAGTLSLLLPVVLYLGANGALAGFWDQSFVYNSVYGKLPLAAKIAAAQFGFKLFGTPAFMALAAILLAMIAGWRQRRAPSGMLALLAVAVVGLPLEVLLSSLPGRQFAHYYLAWLPVLGLLNAYLAYALWQGRERLGGMLRCAPVGLVIVLVGLNVVPQARAIASGLAERLAHPEPPTDVYRETAAYLQQRTTAQDHVLVWGAEVVVNFLARRPSPTRYVYQFPLYTEGYSQLDCIRELQSDLERRRPPFIVDTSATDGAIAPLERSLRLTWQASRERSAVTAEIEKICALIDRHYVRIHQIGSWVIYAERPIP